MERLHSIHHLISGALKDAGVERSWVEDGRRGPEIVAEGQLGQVSVFYEDGKPVVEWLTDEEWMLKDNHPNLWEKLRDSFLALVPDGEARVTVENIL